MTKILPPHSNSTNRAPLIPPGLLVVAGLIFVLGGFGPNIGLALFAILTLVVGAILLWRPGESPILLFIFCFQWLQASIAIFHANWLGLNVESYSGIRGSMELAALLTLLSLMTLATGMRLGAGLPNQNYMAQARGVALASSMEKWFWLYVCASGGAFVVLVFAYVVPGLSQPLIALASLKWAFFFTLAYATFANSKSEKRFFVLAFALELMQGLGGYFADFKTVFFVTICAGVASRVRMSPFALAGLGFLGALALGLGIAWTAIKGEFRSYASGGLNAQNIAASYGDRLEKFYELSSRLNTDALSFGATGLLRRLSYIEYFGVVLTVVPNNLPYEEGAIWWDAISRPFMPRIFFSDKQGIDDTQRTNMFTRGLAGSSGSTSISLGYVAESYIDFGAYGMMAPIFLFGFLCGLIYRRFLDWGASRGLLGMGLSTAVLLPTAFLETSVTKTIGGLAVAVLVAWAFAFTATPQFFPWLRART